MHSLLEPVCDSLDALSASVIAGWTGDQTLMEAFGWNCPAITRQGLAGIPKRMADRIRESSPEGIGSIAEKQLQEIPRHLQLLQGSTVPQLFNGGNIPPAISAYMATLDWVALILDPLLSWQSIQDPNAMPPKLARRVRTLNSRLNQIAPDVEGLGEQVKRIQDAHDAAEALPTDIEDLKDARKRIQETEERVAGLAAKVHARDTESEKALISMGKQAEDAVKIISQCEDAYRAATSKSLAGAFEKRASSLAASMWVWVVGLVVALVLGSFAGANRLEGLTKALSEATPEWGTVWLNIALSVFCVGGPLWFAWVATKQLGQRFRLAEDYAFKASVAKAYEGYRREAARIDEAFEARLFSSALMRLEEAPLRLVESATHGSPWHEIIASQAFQKAMDTLPEFKDSVVEIFKRSAESIVAKKDATSKMETLKSEGEK